MLPPQTTVGPVGLIVPDLDSSIQFYEDVLGFKTLERESAAATLGTASGEALLELIEKPDAIRPGRRSPGLFHFAVLLPNRAELGRLLVHLTEAGWHLSGAGDHLVSEALYLNDPDGNGIELYADRPRETWEFKNGMVQMDTLPVDIDSLIAEAKKDSRSWTGLPPGTTMGHVHIKVSDVDAAGRFYRDLIGFDLMAKMPQAQFVAADGYHHHLGLNSWTSNGSPSAPPDSQGLRGFWINVPTEDSFEETIARLRAAGMEVERTRDGAVTRDPSNNGVWLRVAPSA